MKTYVRVNTDFDTVGQMHPRSIIWKDGRVFPMKYYVTADIHGFYSILHDALEEAGFFAETQPHKLIVLGDLFDRGMEAPELQDFILKLMEEDRIILVKGNHEDLFEVLLTEDEGLPYSAHVSNGTYKRKKQRLDQDDPASASSMQND